MANLSADYRNGIDVMTTETTCWSSIWQTDDTTKEYFVQHGRPEAYKELKPADVAYYDGCIELDLFHRRVHDRAADAPQLRLPDPRAEGQRQRDCGGARQPTGSWAARSRWTSSARSATMAASTLIRALWPAAPAHV